MLQQQTRCVIIIIIILLFDDKKKRGHVQASQSFVFIYKWREKFESFIRVAAYPIIIIIVVVVYV